MCENKKEKYTEIQKALEDGNSFGLYEKSLVGIKKINILSYGRIYYSGFRKNN